jgi:hypothetical protein
VLVALLVGSDGYYCDAVSAFVHCELRVVRSNHSRTLLSGRSLPHAQECFHFFKFYMVSFIFTGRRRPITDYDEWLPTLLPLRSYSCETSEWEFHSRSELKRCRRAEAIRLQSPARLFDEQNFRTVKYNKGQVILFGSVATSNICGSRNHLCRGGELFV